MRRFWFLFSHTLFSSCLSPTEKIPSREQKDAWTEKSSQKAKVTREEESFQLLATVIVMIMRWCSGNRLLMIIRHSVLPLISSLVIPILLSPSKPDFCSYCLFFFSLPLHWACDSIRSYLLPISLLYSSIYLVGKFPLILYTLPRSGSIFSLFISLFASSRPFPLLFPL